MKRSLFVFAMFGLLGTCAKETISIGTGGITGTYYPVGSAICRLVEKNNNMWCLVQSTNGSVQNANSVADGKFTFGFAQSDVVFHKINGTGKFEGNADDSIRSVMSVYPELLSFVVSKSSKIKNISDLKDKVYNTGSVGSGNEVTTLEVFKAKNFDLDLLKQMQTLPIQECPKALATGKIDGYSYMVGHPTANITDATILTSIDILDISGSEIDKMMQKYPYFTKGVIPKNTYEGIDRDINSIGVKALLITSKDTSDEKVRVVLKAVLDNFDEYKKLHPVLNSITKESLVQDLYTPLHPAAEAIFREYGVLK